MRDKLSDMRLNQGDVLVLWGGPDEFLELSDQVLLVMFGAAALLTQILSDSATTGLLGPVAIAVAVALELPPEPFVVCTAVGAVASFLTPIGHHGNLLILNPGQNRFGDFLRVGVPLTLLIALTTAWLSQWLWLGGAFVPPWPAFQ